MTVCCMHMHNHTCKKALICLLVRSRFPSFQSPQINVKGYKYGAECGHFFIWLFVVFIWLSITYIPTSLIRLWVNQNSLLKYWLILSYYV